ncbi:Uncharacterised protein [Escherichia coli]|nr:Uncharacterised protein [Escherichia coli]CAD6111384.1 Uncharacterised protein [Escherichia coli]CAD6181129.1 Uncharacterised protein [Escherichia coli]
MKTLLLAMAGLLPGMVAHAAGISASAELNVSSGSVAVSHSLTSVTMEGTLSDGAVLANGLVDAGDQSLKEVELRWDRAINPDVGHHSPTDAILFVKGNRDHTLFPVKIKAVTPVRSHRMLADSIRYQLATPGHQFHYQVVNASQDYGAHNWKPAPGRYDMAVVADVWVA